MTNEEWQEVVENLVNAKRRLAAAWSVLDGTDGATKEAERAFSRATDAIDDVYRSEAASEANGDRSEMKDHPTDDGLPSQPPAYRSRRCRRRT